MGNSWMLIADCGWWPDNLQSPISNLEIERRAFVHFCLGPGTPAVALDDALDNGEADARAFVFLGAMQALEDPEEFVGVAHVEAHAVVADEIADGRWPLCVAGGGWPMAICDLRFVIGYLPAHFNPRHFSRPSELERVRDQVDEHLLEQHWVGAAGGQIANLNLQPPVSTPPAQVLTHLPC